MLFSGRVTDARGKGLFGAEVRLDWGRTRDLLAFLLGGQKPLGRARTDARGEWKISVPGKKFSLGTRVHVTAWKAGFVPGQRPVSLKEGMKTCRVPDLRLSLGTPIWGEVLDEKGRPVGDVTLLAGGPGSFYAAPVKTDRLGRYVFPGFPPGEVRLIADAKGFALAFRKVRVAPAAYPLRVDFHLDRGLSISGEVLNEGRRPVQGAKVALERKMKEPVSFSWRAPGESDRTGPDGKFRIGGLEDGGVFDLFVEAEGFLNKAVRNVRAGTRGLSLVLSRGCGVKGRVLDFRGKPVVGAWVEASSYKYGFWRTRVGKGGWFSGWGLGEGRWTFWARRGKSLGSGMVSCFLRKDEIKDLGVFRIPEPARFQVTVLDPDGLPVAGAEARMAPERGEDASNEGRLFMIFSRRKTGKGGKARFEELTPGKWRLEVYKRGFPLLEGGAFRLAPGEEKSATVRFSRGGTLLVVARDPSGKPRAGAHILLFPKNGRHYCSLETKADGRGRIRGLVPDEYLVRFDPRMVRSSPNLLGPVVTWLPRHGEDGKKKVLSWTVRVEEGKETRLEVTLPGRWVIRGYVRDALGPARGVEVKLFLPFRTGSPGKLAFSGPDGFYEMDGVEPGHFHLAWSRPGRVVDSRVDLRLGPEGGVLEKNLVLPTGSIEGRVVDSGGRPVKGLLVEIRGKKKLIGYGGGLGNLRVKSRGAPFLAKKEIPRLRTDGEGRFHAEEVPDGVWTLVFKREGSRKVLASKQVTVKEGKKTGGGTTTIQDG